jgi:CRISPR-associated protein Cas1
MLCGKDHMPNGLLLPIGAHSRHAAIVEDQLAISKPMKKRLWQRIVVSKINNQARVLDMLGLNSKTVQSFSSRVLSGDTSNMESAAASVYFRQLLSEGTRRSGPYTPALDYGYAVLRAGIGRTAVSGGWLVSRGIHHSNDLNAFNLVDDLIEPFRPAIDLLICHEKLAGELTPNVRSRLSSIFEMLVRVDGKTTTIQSAIAIELDTLKSAVKSSNPILLKLPEIIPVQFAEQE